MYLGLLQFELLIRDAQSIKDKRRAVKSVKDRLHREHLVSVAEVAFLDQLGVAGLAVAIVNRDARYVQSVLDTILDKLRKSHDAELGEHRREILHADQLPGTSQDESGDPLWTEAEKREQA